ncbi:DNA-binding transcriptional regulator, MarR family [Quadrisphaera granulorum]|uniref:DNA-binding MarR family transcriptional regulator n=1 Tax=Quadrisphaera granulorum TaxID=317664 RepID=A0A315ZN99_9ACTN|nr:MarR family transcriptional regulator [Quadrisphaera granulorum]PWJ46480.1 DNA-binding MarR family transcriptional regulator [Quadrisphaera granulorum]SZE99038.1 DNA-binding transcriptional regulator, MarR family [Quadrisphaera granulorum]
MPSATDLSTALEDLLSWARRLAPPGDLSLASTTLLARLARDGGSGVSALATAEGVSQPAMSQMVARLERDGLVTRTADPQDGRAAVVVLTDTGRELVSARRAARAAALADLLDTAPPGDAEQLLAATPALTRLAQAALAQSALARRGALTPA